MDITAETIKHLNRSGLGAAAYPAVPAKRPDTFLIVEQTGGTRPHAALQTANVDIDCWAQTRSKAEALAARAEDAMLDWDAPNVFGVSLEAHYNNPDPDSGSPRVTISADITISE